MDPSRQAVPRITTTAYAVLGLLAVGEASAYDLAQRMARSVGHVLPRAQSVVYEEPKRLAARGLVEVRKEARGRRSVAVYRITEDGRAALRSWLGEPPAFPQLDAEAVVKALFADQGTRAQLLDTLRTTREDAERRLAALAEQAGGYGDGGPFPDRLAVIALSGRFAYDHLRMLADWAAWAQEQVQRWDEVEPAAWAAQVFEQVQQDQAQRGPQVRRCAR